MKANRRRRRRGPKLSNGVELQPGNAWLYGYGTSSGRTPSYLKAAELAKSNSATEKHLRRGPRAEPDRATNANPFPWPELQRMVGGTFKTLGQVSQFTLSGIDPRSVRLILKTGQNRAILRASFESAWKRIQAGCSF